MKQIVVSLIVLISVLSSCLQVSMTPKEVNTWTGENSQEEKTQVNNQEQVEDIQHEKNTQKETHNNRWYSLGDEINIKPGETIWLNNTDLKITFVELISDSRCPKDVQCFWEWVWEVLFKSMDGESWVLQKLEISPSWEGSLVYEIWNGFKAKILWLDPYPVNAADIQEDEYVLKLIITKS